MKTHSSDRQRLAYQPRLCPVTGRPMKPARRQALLAWAFSGMGLLSLLWFLVRVVPKPSRAGYPCQRAAFPLASGFVVWLLAVFSSAFAWRKTRSRKTSHITAMLWAGAAASGALLAITHLPSLPALAGPDPAHGALGVAKGIFPGRVAWVYAPEATDWAGYTSAEHWYQTNHTDLAVVSTMMSKAIQSTTGTQSDTSAWDALFRYFNRQHGKGDQGYVPGEKIAIKINLTTCNARSGTQTVDINGTYEKRNSYWDGNWLNTIDNSPEMLLSLLRQLANTVGVAQADISLGDPTGLFPKYMWDILHPEFPGVHYFDNYGGQGRTRTERSSVPFNWSATDAQGKVQDYLPVPFAEATYLINFAVLKGHSVGVTLCGKNHYGSLLRCPDGYFRDANGKDKPGTLNYLSMHASTPDPSIGIPGMGRYRAIVDLQGHPGLGGKTLLYLVDGLFAGRFWDSHPVKWNMQPFSGDWPSSLFASLDPVAIDSVCYDFLLNEWPNVVQNGSTNPGNGLQGGAEDYLHEMALSDNPPSGTFYDPGKTGTRLPSMGVHEHWNNATDKQYSRNLGTGLGIELVPIRYGAPPPPVITAFGPTNLTVLPNQPFAFSVTATGADPLAYQWRRDGTNISGATSDAYSVAQAQTTNAGTYTVAVTDVNGTTLSPSATLTVLPVVPLPQALNNTSLAWTTDDSTPWFGQTVASHDGSAAARSYFIADGQQSRLRTQIQGPGTLWFWWKVSSETNADTIVFSAAGIEMARASGEVDWTLNTFYLPAGAQELIWSYSKNVTGSAGADAAWVDQVTFTAKGTKPTITVQPVSRTVPAGTSAQFSITAIGTPPLSYQWSLDGTQIPGATDASYNLPEAWSEYVGTYSASVTNDLGSAVSSNATLAVVQLVQLGSTQIQPPTVLSGLVAISAGAWHNLGLKADGTVTAWGDNWNGQCQVPTGLGGVIAVAAGGYHSLALRSDGTVAAWGANDSRQASVPAGLKTVRAIAAGEWHSLALQANGTVLAWGDDAWHQADVPAGLSNVTAIAAGGSHSLALRADGTVVGWGQNTDSQGIYIGQADPPLNLSNVVAIAAGSWHSVAVRADGAIVTWGGNSQGQRTPPPGLSSVVAAAGGASHTVVIEANTIAAAWGENTNGQCDIPAGVSNIVSVAAGNSDTLLLLGRITGPPQALWPVWDGTQFGVFLSTVAGRTYALEFKEDATAPGWTTLPPVRGRGGAQVLFDTSGSGSQRFYRVHQW